MKQAKLPEWDLSDLYKNIDDPQIPKDKKWIRNETKRLTKAYKDKVNNPKITAKNLLEIIRQMQVLEEKLYIYLCFANLLHEKETIDEKINKFYQDAQEFGNEISSQLIWFLLEWQKLPDQKAKQILGDKTLSGYYHFLSHSREFSKYKLSEPEEIIMTKKDQTAADAYIKFYDEVNGSQKYKIKGKILNYSQIIKILSYDSDRNKRKLAAQAITKSLDESKYHYTFSLNNLLLDKKINDEIRNYKYPQQNTFLRYEVEPQMVDALVKAVTSNYKICESYYKSKAKLLKIDQLHEWDRYSPLFSEAKQTVAWDQAKKAVLENFEKFSPEFGQIAKKFFDNNWIDAEIKDNKSSGAFCSYITPSLHPVILMSFTGEPRAVSTLAHELGHAVHAYLSKNNNFYNFWPSTATAEIASIFCESVVFEALLAHTHDPKVKLNMLAAKIEESFATIFRQTAFYLFETDLHNHRREKGQLTTDEISNYFQNRLQQMFGKSLTLTEGHKLWWMNVGHFYHYNFYVFTYAFGEALTRSLFAQYKNQGEKFVKKYINALSLGGSVSPIEVTKTMGVDITKPGFWTQGIKILEKQVEEFEKLALLA